MNIHVCRSSRVITEFIKYGYEEYFRESGMGTQVPLWHKFI